MKKTLLVASAVAMFAVSVSAWAEPECSTTITRVDVGRCAVRASLVVRGEVQTREALEGRRTAVSPILPANPTLALTGARRDGDSGRATNWSATLSQELEIAGQRGARRRAAELETEAQTERVAVAARDAAATAWISYFDALASAHEVEILTRLSANAGAIAKVAQAMADKGVLSPVDADVADAGRIGVESAQIAAERRARGAQLALATALGFDPAQAVAVRGELVPLARVEDDARTALGTDGRERPEVRALDAERRAQEATANAYARSRVPNPTLSLFVENDGFNERVLGAGVSFPIPLPQPIGRLYDGEIAQARALAGRAATDAERVRRQARLELLSALAEYDMRKRQREAFTDERVTRAEQDIDAIGREIQAGRLAVRDALLSQQALMTVLRGSVEARLALCVASVDLARAAGVRLEGADR